MTTLRRLPVWRWLRTAAFPLAALAARLVGVGVRLRDGLSPAHSRTTSGRVVFVPSSIGYDGNARAVYDAMQLDLPPQQALPWLRLPGQAGPPQSPLLYSLRGLAAYGRCAVVVTDGYLPPWLPLGRRRIVELWHGVGVKTLGVHEQDMAPAQLRQVLAQARRWAAFVATTPYTAAFFADAFRLPAGVVQATGYPRTDGLLVPGRPEALEQAVARVLGPHRRVILWAPTWRREAGFDPLALPRRLATRLDRWDAVLLLKLHPNVARSAGVAAPPPTGAVADSEGGATAGTAPLPVWPTALPRVGLVSPDAAVPTTDWLRLADLLVTDYSSIAYDYLALDRPVAIFVEDLGAYLSTRGLVADWERLMPGPVCRSEEELQAALDEWAVQGADLAAAARRRVAKQMLGQVDGRATERAVRLVRAVQPVQEARR